MSTHPYQDILQSGFAEYQRYVNPLIAQRAKLAGEPIEVVGTEAGMLRDRDGRTIEDFHGTQAFGHRNPHIAAAIRDYLDSDLPSWYPARVNPFAGRLARRLCERTGYDNAFFGCTGSDAVEAALKLARALTGKPRLLALTGGYHGCTFGSVSVMSPGYLRDPFGPFVEGATHIEFNDTGGLTEVLAGGDVAAVIVEPIQGEGGVRALSQDFIDALCALTDEAGAVLIADEVQTALGRTGRGFLATEAWPRRPDVVLLAKHLGGGLVPISAMLTRRELFVQAYGKHFASGESHNTTMGFNALSCVAAMAALDLIDDQAIARVRAEGQRLGDKLTAALASNPLVREVRGAGFMRGVALAALDHPWLSFEHFGIPELAHQSVMAPLLCHRLYRRGFFCFTCGHDWSIFRLQPRFDVPADTLDRFVEAVAEELGYLAELG